MSEIKLQCVEQNLHLLTKPEIFSGDVNYDTISVDFDKTWDNFTKTAIFYQSRDNVYYQLLDINDKAIIPKEVLSYKGSLYFGVFGVNGDVVITSEVLKYKINQGVPTEELIAPDPRPDIFEQILADYDAIKKVIDKDYEDLKAKIELPIGTNVFRALSEDNAGFSYGVWKECGTVNLSVQFEGNYILTTFYVYIREE